MAFRWNDRTHGILCRSRCDGGAHGILEQSALDDHRLADGADVVNGRLRRARFLAMLAGALAAGCSRIGDSLPDNAAFRRILEFPETLDLAILGSGQPLAREYSESDISPDF